MSNENPINSDGTFTTPTSVPSFFAPVDTTAAPAQPTYGDGGVYAPPTFEPEVPVESSKENKWHCYDARSLAVADGTDQALFAGPIHPDLLQAWRDNNEQPVFAIQRSVTVDQFGTKVSVWYPANMAMYVNAQQPIPGEVRKVGLVQV